jgi:prepilin-type N-terminal cleavage/methylation domain-containing protein
LTGGEVRMMRLFKPLHKKIFCGSSRGFTFVEVTIGIIVLGLLLAAIPAALVVSVNSQHRQYETRVAESLSRSQLEYIKAQEYNPWVKDCGWCNEHGNITMPYGAPLPRIENYIVQYNPVPVSLTGEELGIGDEDSGVQKIVVRVFRDTPEGTRPILETVNYKVDTWLVISGYNIQTAGSQ